MIGQIEMMMAAIKRSRLDKMDQAEQVFLEAAEARTHEGPRIDSAQARPFDDSRLILGPLIPRVIMGRS